MEEQNRLDPSIRPYHVFINHRGPDVKNSLASTIYYSLRGKGLHVFFDTEEFQPGQGLEPTITNAIRTSLVHIAIVSPRYAESPWCLDELRQMLKSGARIFPVFYNVPPNDLLRLQNGKGIFANSFEELKSKKNNNNKCRYDSETLLQWRKALEEVSNISGLELDSSKFNGGQGKLVNTLVAHVMAHVTKERKKPLKALDDAFEDFIYFLSESRNECDSVRIVGMVGVTGSGKTTLAEEFYHRRLGYFDRCSFLLDVRKASERNGLQALQSQLLKDLTGHEEKICNISKGKEMLEDGVNCLSRHTSCKFLIVIDDVDNPDQLDALLLEDCLLGSGSWVIVTCRDKSILKLSKISLHYKMKPLVRDDARELLCREAFHQVEPIPGFDNVVETALSKCGGLPLYLKLLGRHLHLYANNREESWEQELDMVSDIGDICKITYNALEEEEKQIFLDIACFFQGMEKKSAIRIWDGLGWRGARALLKLENMCLVEINEKNRMKMEEFHSNLGREIADQQLITSPDLPCRVWRANEVTDFFEGRLPVPEHIKNRGFTEGTRSNHRQFGRKRLRTYTVSSVTIELFHVNGDLPDDILSDRLRDLVWFRWINCPRTSIPLPEMSNLRVLDLVNGNFTTLCDSTSQ
ncbi:hypothetical protein KI387_033112, partial [Taxus chinensis]